MIEDIKQIIADNSEEKHFVEYGKGVFATEDTVDEIAEEIVKLFAIHNVSQQRELLIDFYSKQNGGMNDTNKHAIIREVDNYIESINCG